ncbi:FAD-binding oxidoreductase [Brevundimonas sp. AAP58]|uniref:NAD(P)/FAD-dependent oxidoreductase n=1 Tax=Brevundimonas sp. AAP58 TaxID=1523422 RepID=UPI0006B8D65B|nr:FAD-binding oxidoreductase [Brevundimonas sp. AAP58]
MADLSTDIVILGAGVLGLAVAAELTARGHEVRLIDPGGANSSSVAAGMIAPALESLLDGAASGRAALLKDAAALWPAFAEAHSLALDPTPAEWRGPDPEGVADALIGLGFAVERPAGAVAAPSDIRIDPLDAMARLLERLAGRRVAAMASAVSSDEEGWTVFTDVEAVRAKHMILATGVGAPIRGLPRPAARAVSDIHPIAGQIGLVAVPLTDRVLRGPGGYVVPAGAGALIGATMVEGQSPAVVDPDASARLIAQAEALIGQPIDTPIDWRAAVRGATPDGLPLAGPAGPGLHLALAPRRNGWLLAPLVARIVADGVEGRPRDPYATALDPLRFSPPEA